MAAALSANIVSDALATLPSSTGYRVAGTLREAITIWGIVYDVYLRSGLIDANPFGIHTSRQAISRHSLVVTDAAGDMTLTSMRDSSAGLPLDTVFSDELDALRQRGRVLTEIGLFADRRDPRSGTIEALLAAMVPAMTWGFAVGSDLVIGVHPRHAPFYRRAFNAVVMVEEGRTYRAVKNHPCVLLWMSEERLQNSPLRHRGVAYYLAHPIPQDTLRARPYSDLDVESALFIEAYMAYRQGVLTLDKARGFLTGLLGYTANPDGSLLPGADARAPMPVDGEMAA